MMAGGVLAGCALQDVGAPIYNRTGGDSTASQATTSPVVSYTGDSYTVQPGDTLYSIATRNGCNPTELAQANGITDPTLLSPGTVLRLTSARTQPVTELAAADAQLSSTEVTIGTGAATETTQGSNTVSLTPAAPAADDAEGQEFEFTPLVTPDAIEHPLIVNLFAEIVDVSVICSTDFSPDGTSLAIGSDRTLRVYDIEKDAFLFQYNIEDSESQNHIRSICWTNDGSQIICGGEDGKIRVLNLPIVSAPEQDQVRCFEAASGEVFQVCLSPDNSLLAAVSGNGALSLFKREDYSLICTLERDESNTVATALAISPDNKIIAVGYSDSYVSLWDAETHKQLAMEVLHSQGVYAVKFAPSPSPDRYRLVTGSLDNSVKILDLIPVDDKIEFEVRNNMEGHSSFVLALAIDPTGEWLLSGSKDLTAKLSSLSTGQMIYSIKAHSNSVITVAFSPKGNMFCTGSGDHIVKIWSMVPEESEERA